MGREKNSGDRPRATAQEWECPRRLSGGMKMEQDPNPQEDFEGQWGQGILKRRQRDRSEVDCGALKWPLHYDES